MLVGHIGGLGVWARHPLFKQVQGNKRGIASHKIVLAEDDGATGHQGIQNALGICAHSPVAAPVPVLPKRRKMPKMPLEWPRYPLVLFDQGRWHLKGSRERHGELYILRARPGSRPCV